MSLFDELRSYGVNVDEGISRLGGNENLYKRLLGTFTGTISNYYVTPDFPPENCKETIEKAHTIKGIAGNLSITPVYDAYSQIVSLLRSDQTEEAKKVIKEVLNVQEEIISCIKKYM